MLSSNTDPLRSLQQTGLTVLVVDDDSYGLTFFRSSLKLSGYKVVTAISAMEAQEQLEKLGCKMFSAVLTDFRMPERTGIDLLRWIRQKDPSLATIIITAQGEKELVKRSLSEGAVDFVEKPITHQLLREVIAKAVAQTLRMRKYESDQEGLRDAGRMDQIFNTFLGPDIKPHILMRYQPLHEVGGDFFNAQRVGEDSFLIVAGDVSGHDIRSGFVSAYFQGMIRGLSEINQSIDQGLALFNRLLCKDWRTNGANGDVTTSLVVSALEIDLRAQTLRVTSCGFPPVVLCDRHGFVTFSKFGAFPMGWDINQTLTPETLSLDGIEFLSMHTDGLIDFATELEIDPFSLIYRLLQEADGTETSALHSADDILLLRFFLNPNHESNTLYQPILHESYSGDEYEDIDHLQAVWRRSIQFAIEDELGDRLYDLLICLREGMLNAFLHGCEGLPEKVCTLQMSYNAEEKIVRVRIDDPGKGHSFDLKQRLSELPEAGGRQLGLGIIQHLSDRFGIENKGTTHVFDFHINP